MRYVILEHRQLSSVHWDLLLAQASGVLRTWALEQCPPGPGWQIARALPPHREAYLRYQGPVGPSRGWVKRWDEGCYRPLAERPDVVRVLLSGRRLRGLLELYRPCEGTDVWRYRFQLALGA